MQKSSKIVKKMSRTHACNTKIISANTLTYTNKYFKTSSDNHQQNTWNGFHDFACIRLFLEELKNGRLFFRVKKGGEDFLSSRKGGRDFFAA